MQKIKAIAARCLSVTARALNLLFKRSSLKNKRKFSRNASLAARFMSFLRKSAHCVSAHFKKFDIHPGHAIISLSLILLLILGSLQFPASALGATYTFTQTSWSGGADADATAAHPTNQTGWTKFQSKDSSITAGADGVSLQVAEQTYTLTSDSDWGAGTNSGTSVSGNGADSSIAMSASGFSADASGEVKLSVGTATVCVVTSAGGVKCWGDNSYGQVGDGTTLQRDTPTDVSGLTSGVVSVSAGTNVSCALTSTGSVKCWGRNSYGALGNNSYTSSSIPVDVWSGPGDSTPLSGVQKISVGGTSVCALMSVGTVKCWGQGTYGQIGRNSNVTSLIPVDVWTSSSDSTPLSGVIDISVGNSYACALVSDGTAKCWGYNPRGNLGDNSTTTRLAPVDVWTSSSDSTPLSGVSKISAGLESQAGNNHTCALMESGGVKCWGYNSDGQLGDNSTTQRTTPVDVVASSVDLSPLGSVSQVSAGGSYHTCVLVTGGTVKCWGTNGFGTLGDGTTTSRKTPVSVTGLTGVVAISTGQYESCAIINDGTVKCWGANYSGSIGNGKFFSKNYAGSINGMPKIAQAGGLADSNGEIPHQCFIIYGATEQENTVRCWGSNSNGQMGNGTYTRSTLSTPVYVSGTSGALLSGVVQLASGGIYTSGYTCALIYDGTVKCWGYNVYGQLGDGTTTQRTNPVPVYVSGTSGEVLSGVEEISVASTNSFACARLSDGTARCWGRNNYGQLGNGTTTDSNNPVPVYVSGTSGEMLSGISHISAGSQGACAVLTDGTVRCWGRNNYGQLGNGTTTDSNNPVPVYVSGTSGTMLSGVAQVAAGSSNTYALMQDGTIRSWGYNAQYQLGDGTNTNRYNPVSVYISGTSGPLLSSVIQVGSGAYHACAVISDGTVKCWGSGSLAQIGDGSVTGRTSPTLVIDGEGVLTGVIDMNMGSYNSCVLLTNGAVKCWGTNDYGSVSGPLFLLASYSPTYVSGFGGYESFGQKYTSDVIDMGIYTESGAITIDTTLPSGTEGFVKVRSSNSSDMSGADSWEDCGSPVSGWSLSDAVCFTEGHRYLQIQFNPYTSDVAATPLLNSFSVSYDSYPTSASLTGNPFDSTDSANVVAYLSWRQDASLPAGTGVTLSVRSSASDAGISEAVWSDFSDSVDGCTNTGGNVECVLSAIPDTLKDGSGDRWFQYKVTLTSLGNATASLDSLTVRYVVNATPEFDASFNSTGVSASQVSDSADANWGKVSISYRVKDADSTTGSNTPGYITPTFYYSTGGEWTEIPSGNLAAGDGDNKAVSEDEFTTYTAVWDAASTLGSVYSSNVSVRVTIDDNEAANNTVSADSASFAVDAVAPAISSATMDLSEGTLSFAANDNNNLSYRISNNADYSADGVNASSGEWQSVESNSLSLSPNWTVSGDLHHTVYLSVRDAFGNASSRSVVAPYTPTSFDIKDISNIENGNYRLFVSWAPYQSAEGAAFASYKVMRSDDGGATFSDYSTISNVNTNYATDFTVSSSTTYSYKVRVVDSDGDYSAYSSILSDLPNGQGGSDFTAPVISAVTVAEVQATWARITWTTDELSDSVVSYGTSNSYGSAASSTSFVTSHTVTLTGLTPNTTYYFKAASTDLFSNEALDDNGAAGYSFTTSQGTVISDVTVENVADTSASIVWNTNSASNSYVIYDTNTADLSSGGTTVGSATIVESANGGLIQHRVSLTGLTPRTTYYFYVRSSDAAGNTATDNYASAYYNFVTTYDTKPPVISNVGTPVTTASSIVVVWQTDELADSQVNYGTAEGVLDTSSSLDSTLSINHVTTLTSLLADTTYYFQVRSADTAGNTATSTTSYVKTAKTGETRIIYVGGGGGSAVADTTAPSVTNVLATSTGAFDAIISFDTNEQTIGYVKYGQTSGYGKIESTDVFATHHDIKLSGLRMGTTYHFKVKAQDKSGNFGQSDDSTFTTRYASEDLDDMITLQSVSNFQDKLEELIESALPSLAPPSISELKVASTTEQTALVTWKTNIPAFGAVGYATVDEYDPTKPNPYVNELSKSSTKTTNHALELAGLSPSTLYHLQARAFSIFGVVGASPDYSFSTKASKIKPEVVSRSTDSIELRWTTNLKTTSQVQYKNSRTGVRGEVADETLANTHALSIKNLEPDTLYNLRVFGIDKNGVLVEADPLSVRTVLDISAPVLSPMRIDNALLPGKADRLQTVVSWKSDEPGSSVVWYEEGVGGKDRPKHMIEDKNVTTEHIVIIPDLKPSTVYRFQIGSKDQAGNLGTSNVKSVLTPQAAENVLDVIIKNLEDSFGFLKKLRD